MSRPGFVLEVDDRTPPLVVTDGDGFRLERFPLGTRVVYPADSLPAVADLGEAVAAALDAPLDSPPLAELLRPGMRLTLAFDDISTPVPRMRQPDIRAGIVEAVLTRAARAGVDDVALVAANGLNRPMTDAELRRVVGERAFRSFFVDGLLTNHDAEDTNGLTRVGSTDTGEVMINARAASSDLLVLIHLVTSPRGGGAMQVATGLGSAATIDQVSGLAGLQDASIAEAVADQIGQAVPIFQVAAVLDNDVFAPSVDFLGKREWEWRVREQVAWLAIRRGLALTPAKARRRILTGTEANFHATAVHAGSPDAVRAASTAQALAQQVVEVDGQADVGVIGVPLLTPYSVDSAANPILAAWQGLAGLFSAHTGRPVVRPGGALILYHPLPADFSPLHHPSYVDFFADVLTSTTDPAVIHADFEPKFATDPWYVHLYRTSLAFHGVHPLHRWYEICAARAHCSDIVWVGADRSSAERMGFRAASTLADALEIVSSTVGRSPTITYLHTPPQLIADVR